MRWTTSPLPGTAGHRSRVDPDGRGSCRLDAPAAADAEGLPDTAEAAPDRAIAAAATPDRGLAPALEERRLDDARPRPGVLRLRHADRA